MYCQEISRNNSDNTLVSPQTDHDTSIQLRSFMYRAFLGSLLLWNIVKYRQPDYDTCFCYIEYTVLWNLLYNSYHEIYVHKKASV